MNFGSEFVYNYSDSEEEYVSDDEFEEGMTRVHSDTENDKCEASLSGGETVTAASIPVARTVKATVTDSFPCVKEQRKSAGFFGRLFKTTSKDETAPPPKPHPVVPSKRNRKKHHWLSEPKSFGRRQPAPPPSSHGKKWRRADTNVISVNFGTLKRPSDMHTGDPFYCSGCGVVLSKLSKLIPAEDDNRTWICEFCDERNLIDLVDEEIPASDDVTFMLSPAPCTTSSSKTGEDESLVVFCVDTSGSMCVTTEVPGTVNFRGSRLDRLQSLNVTGESQYLPRQSKNVTYVSRLQGVQAAVDHQLEEMLNEHGSRRVALITFNSEVTSVGDGTAGPVHISGDKLSNKEELIKIGSELSLPNHITQTRHKLGDKVFALEEGGQTALGPALIISVSLACQVPGSKVIICTDGMANVGLGNLDQLASTQEAYERTSAFFDEVSSMATGKGVSVSVISIKGTDCKMVELGKVAEATGGQVNIVDPLKLTQEFGNILADPIIATNVSATLQLHKGLYFRHEASEQSKITKFVGNVTKDSEVTFEYGVRRQVKKKTDHNKDVKTSEATAAEKKTEEVIYDHPRSTAVYDTLRNEPLSIQQVGSHNEPVYDNHGNTAAPPKQTGDAVPTSLERAEVDRAIISTQAAGEREAAKPRTEKPDAMVTDATKDEEAVTAPPPPQPPTEGASAGVSHSEGASAGVPQSRTQQPILDTSIKELPFQLKIKYMDLDGAEALRVITQGKPVTRDRIQAENEMNMEAIGAHACQRSAAMALKGEYTPSRMNAFMYQRLLHRKATGANSEEATDVYDNFYANALPMENRVQSMQSSERRRRGVTYSDESDGEEEEVELLVAAADKPPKKLKAKGKKSKSMQRRIECDDTSANVFYSNVNIGSKGFKKM